MASRRTGGTTAVVAKNVSKAAKKPSKPADASVPYEVAKQRILAVIRAIPPGRVAAYGEVARRAGLPGRARLTARVLGDNDDPDLPWHRVLRAGGRIASPEGSRAWREQSARLRAEGVRVEAGRVHAAPEPDDIDALLWGPTR